MTQCSIYGIAAWEVQLEGATQDNLVITPSDEPTITVDRLEIAQFIYMLLHTPQIRDVIDTLAKKAVLILGRFPDERQAIIDTLSQELRQQNYSPIVFNTRGTENNDFNATVRTLIHITRFVFLDLTDADDTIRRIADEIVPHSAVPIQPLLHLHKQQYQLWRVLHKRRWVLAPYHYDNATDLQQNFQTHLLQPIYKKMIELEQKKPFKLFFGYAYEDENKTNELKKHLISLKNQGIITWDNETNAQYRTIEEIEKQLSEAHIILLLLSPDFLNSDNCTTQIEMALKRYEQCEARVIPIILRPCQWQQTWLKDIGALPKNRQPISQDNLDTAFFDISNDILHVVTEMRGNDGTDL